MKNLFVLAFYCHSLLLTAQQPQFIMPIWFEDAIGNKDTVWVGGDPNASYQNINAQFGEVAITTPFDSVFEVRAVHTDDSNWKTSEIVIEGNDTPGHCYLPARTRIMFNAKYPPVKISWDTLLLKSNYPCNINTILTPDQKAFLLQNWYEADIIYCMMTQSNTQIDDLFPIQPPDQLQHMFEVEGIGMKKLPGLWYSGFWDAPYCYTALSDAEPVFETFIKISPNPATEMLTFNLPLFSTSSNVEIICYDLNGHKVLTKFIKTSIVPTINMDIGNLQTGIYYYHIALSNNQVFRGKFIKV
jgi:hypothetical protein